MGSPRFISPAVNSSRTFFSLSDISKLAQLTSNNQTPGSDPDEQKFHARKILPYSQSQLYALVSDVPSYSSFIPFCSSSTVLVDTKQRQVLADWKPDDKPFDIDAELKVGFGGLEERYISRVAGRPFESVTVSLSNSALADDIGHSFRGNTIVQLAEDHLVIRTRLYQLASSLIHIYTSIPIERAQLDGTKRSNSRPNAINDRPRILVRKPSTSDRKSGRAAQSRRQDGRGV